MTYIIGKKVLGRYFVQDVEGRDVYHCKRKNIFSGTYIFADISGREILSFRRTRFTIAHETYELKKQNIRFGSLKREHDFNKLFNVFQSIMNKQFDELSSVKIGTIETQDSGQIEMKAKTLAMGVQDRGSRMGYYTEFMKDNQLIASATKILGIREITKLYEVDITEDQDDPLILASMIMVEIMARGSKNQQGKNRTGVSVGRRSR